AASLAWRAAAGRPALVTDGTTAAGSGEGSYTSFGSLDVEVQDGAVRGPEGVLAGSVLTMIEAVRNLHGLGVPLEDAIAAASTVPGRALGDDEIGRLDVGLPADVVVLDDNLDIARVLVGGEV